MAKSGFSAVDQPKSDRLLEQIFGGDFQRMDFKKCPLKSKYRYQ